jgi:hypothetical protein
MKSYEHSRGYHPVLVISLAAMLLLSACSTIFQDKAEESREELVKRTFGDAPETLDGRIQTGMFSIPLPASWIAERSGNGGSIIIADEEGNRKLELYSIGNRKGLNADTAGEYVARALDSAIEERVGCRSTGYEAAFFSLEGGGSVLSVDLIEEVLVAVAADGAGGLLPYLRIEKAPQDIRERSSCSFHSLDSKWRWYADTMRGFLLADRESGDLFALYGKEVPERVSGYFSELRGGDSAAGNSDILIDNYRAEASYSGFVEDDTRRVALRIDAGAQRYYAFIIEEGENELSIEEMLGTRRYERLFSQCLHIGAPYSSPNRERMYISIEEE